MTFTEAAIEVLRREGKPLHFKKIAELAIRENLLDHVGKIPEEIMADQLAAHARLPKLERRLLPVLQGTFGLVEWGLDEDPQGLDGILEPPADEGLPYRSRERHPIPSRDLSRGAGREQRARRDEERRGRRFPPPAEVAYEILAGAGKALRLVEIAAQGVERLLMPDAFTRDTASLLAALSEDNRRREAAGRAPLFALDGETVTLGAQPEPGERPAVPLQARLPATAGELRRAALAALRRRLREADGATIEWIAARLLEKQGFHEIKSARRGREHVVYTARRRMGLADVRHGIRVLRTGADAVRRDVNELRRDLGHYGAQIGLLVTAGDAVREARAEATAAGQLPILLLCGEAFAEALAEAGVGTVPVVVPEVDEAFFRSAAEAAEKDEAVRRARREERDRGEGREGRERGEGREGRDRGESRERGEGREDRRDGREGRERRERRDEAGRGRPRREEEPAAAEPLEGAPAAEAVEPVEVEATAEPVAAAAPAAPREPLLLMAPADDRAEEDDGEEGDDEGDEGDEGGSADAPEGGPAAAGEAGEGQQGERRRRRRRRRRRGGRGRGREGAPAAAAQGGGEAAAAGTGTPEPQAAPPPPAREPSDGGDGNP